MSGDIIYDTNFYSTLEAEVNAFRKALTKRWRKEVATAIRRNDTFKTAFRRYHAPYGEDIWDYWDPINQVHLIWGSCEVITWAEGDQEGEVPSYPGRTFSPEMGYPPTHHVRPQRQRSAHAERDLLRHELGHAKRRVLGLRRRQRRPQPTAKIRRP
ncbi:hypothetical protein [Plantactinospora sp. B24E8]|uniref:hypothetical protein n=1 Tax=Plantactinospora sp. B24E8 TaxID=3153567 RepID=UPI00325F4C73